MVLLMRIGDICNIQNGERKDRNLNIEGDIPVYGSGMRYLFMTNEFNREGKTCKVNKIKSNRQVLRMNEKYFLNNNAFTIVSKDETILCCNILDLLLCVLIWSISSIYKYQSQHYLDNLKYLQIFSQYKKNPIISENVPPNFTRDIYNSH